MIGWEIPDETIEREDGTHARTINKRYTASLNESATLRQDLAAWRGRDFTPEELAAFDLHSIVGKSCMISVIHRDYNGRPYANVGSIMALPKGTKPDKLSEDVLVFDLDSASIEDVEKLPKWIGDTIKKSSTYKEKTMTPPEVTELPEDDGDLPF